MAHHLPDPVWFWTAVAVMTLAAVVLGFRGRGAAGRVFVLMLAIMVLTLADFAMVLMQWPAGGLAPTSPGEPPAVPEGLPLPSLFWSLSRPVTLVAAVLFVGLVPARRWWIPPGPYHWLVAAALVGAVYAVGSVQREGAVYLRTLVWALVFPLVGLLLLRDAARGPQADRQPLLWLSFAFFTVAVPGAVVQAYDSWVKLDPGRSEGMLAEIWVGDVVGGALVALVALGCATWAVVEAAQREEWDRPLLAFAGGIAGLFVLVLFVLVPIGAGWHKTVIVELLVHALFAVLGVMGILRLEGAGSIRTDPAAARHHELRGDDGDGEPVLEGSVRP